MPFENQLVIVKMKGEDIQGVFDYYEKQKRNNPVAGFTIVVENGKLKQGLITAKNQKLVSITTSRHRTIWLMEEII